MKRADKTINKKFLTGIGAMILLIVCAFITPVLLLGIGDKKRLTQSVGTKIAETDVTIWQENYEADTALRLQNLADGLAEGKQYYVSKQSIEENEDGQIGDIIDKYVISTDWNYVLQDIGLLLEDYIYKKGLHNASVCRYILYDEKLTDGVAIMAYDIWMEVSTETEGNVSMEFVIDSETGTLYALKMILEEETEALTWEDMDIDKFDLYNYMEFFWQDYYTYDETGATNIEIQGIGNVQVVENAAKEAGMQGGDADDYIDPDGMEGYSFSLVYGTNHLQFRLDLLNASKGELEKGVGFVMGIREIEERIPDFLPDHF